MTQQMDLTGRWTGVYFYPSDPEWNANDNMPATPFTAELLDVAGSVTGTMLEPDNLYGDGSGTIPSIIEGNRTDRSLSFVKFSEAAEGYEDPIHYNGELSSDGLVIDGRWSIPDNWSGIFRMQRQSGAEEAMEVERAAERAQ